MKYQEVLTRTEVYLQKISAELVNDKDKKILKSAMEVIEKLMEVEE